MPIINRTQMIQLRSHYKNGKTVEELASMIGDTEARIIGLLGDVYEKPKAKAAAKAEPEAHEEDWEE